MTSGEWITYFMIASTGIFAVWEFVQLYRRRSGNSSAYTASQFVIRKAKSGSKFWKIFILLYPALIAGVGLWLFAGHWEQWCINFDILCNIDI